MKASSLIKMVAILFLLFADNWDNTGAYSLAKENCNNKCSGTFKLCNHQANDMLDVYLCTLGESECRIKCYSR